MERQVLNRIKVVLAEKRLSNKWLALKTGKTESTVCRWANNRMQPSIEQLFDIANALDIDVRALLNSNMTMDVMNPYDIIKEHYAVKQ